MLHTVLARLSALAAIFMITGALADVSAMSHESMPDHAADSVHAGSAHGQASECTGDGCDVCDVEARDHHFAEHCPDCLARVPVTPESIRVERRLHVSGHATPDVPDSGHSTCRPPSLSLSPARSGPATRSPILRL